MALVCGNQCDCVSRRLLSMSGVVDEDEEEEEGGGLGFWMKDGLCCVQVLIEHSLHAVPDAEGDHRCGNRGGVFSEVILKKEKDNKLILTQ